MIPFSAVRPKLILPRGSGADPATTAWVSAVVSAGGTVSGTQQTRVNNLIVALKSHSLFTQLDRLWLFAGESVHQQAKIDIIHLSVGTEQGNLTTTGLGAGGYTGNGTTGYFDTGFNTATGVATAASTMFGFYMQSGSAVGGQFSGSGGTGFTKLNPNEFGNTQCQINNGFVQASIAHPDGMYVGTQTPVSGGINTIYNFSTLNSTSGSLATGANASPAIGTDDLLFCAFLAAGPTVQNFMTDTISAGYVGAGLSSSDVTQFATDLNAYMTAWGINRF